RNILTDSTQRRVESLAEFDFLQRRIDWLRKREEMKEISLNLETRRAMKAADEAFRERMKAEQTELAAQNYPMREVLLDNVSTENTPDEPEPGDALDTGEEADEDEAPPFDIHLRESLRVLSEAIRITPDPIEWTENTRTLAIISAR